MSLAAALLAVGGAISFLMGAVIGFWVHFWMIAHPGEPAERRRMIAHKEALWSSFLCFAIAGWIDAAPVPEAVALVAAVTVVLTGWFAQGQYIVLAQDDPPPMLSRLFGVGALGVNLVAIVALLWAAGAALQAHL